MESPHHVLDCRQELCPGPVIKVSRALKTLGADGPGLRQTSFSTITELAMTKEAGAHG